MEWIEPGVKAVYNWLATSVGFPLSLQLNEASSSANWLNFSKWSIMLRQHTGPSGLNISMMPRAGVWLSTIFDIRRLHSSLHGLTSTCFIWEISNQQPFCWRPECGVGEWGGCLLFQGTEVEMGRTSSGLGGVREGGGREQMRKRRSEAAK